MSYDYIQPILFATLGIVGLLGGIPQIIHLAKQKPHLKINTVTIQRAPNDNYKHRIHLEVENQSKSLTRNGDALNVTIDYFIINKDSIQCGITQNQILSTYLISGAKILADIEAYHSLVPEGNPYSIIFMVKSRDAAIIKKKISYNAAQIEYT